MQMVNLYPKGQQEHAKNLTVIEASNVGTGCPCKMVAEDQLPNVYVFVVQGQLFLQPIQGQLLVHPM